MSRESLPVGTDQVASPWAPQERSRKSNRDWLEGMGRSPVYRPGCGGSVHQLDPAVLARSVRPLAGTIGPGPDSVLPGWLGQSVDGSTRNTRVCVGACVPAILDSRLEDRAESLRRCERPRW